MVDAVGSPADIGCFWVLCPVTKTMNGNFGKIALVLLFPGFCPAQMLAPSEALDRYLAGARDRQAGCSDLEFAVQIEASLPKLRKHGSMSGLKRISQAGRSVYSGLRFTGDNFVKTAVIARFLANEAEPPEPAADTAVSRQNYSFIYDKTADYNGLAAYVYRLKPQRKRVGLFKGELWLDAATAAPLRLWGDFIKSPSMFVRTFRFVQDYQSLEQCSQPVRLLLTVQTRIVGEAQVAMCLHSIDDQPAAAGTSVCGYGTASSKKEAGYQNVENQGR